MTNKTRYIPLLLLLLALFSCTSREEREFSALIEHADSIADRNPDSALAILSPLLSSPKGESLAVPTAKLLRVKIDDKLYRPITGYEHLVTDTLLPYFRYHDKKWLPTALFYAGRICADKGDAPQAIDYYQQTLDAMPEQGGKRFRGLVYIQTGWLFLYQELYEEAISHLKLAYQYELEAKDSIYMAHILQAIGTCYLKKNSEDSAYVYFNKALTLAVQGGNDYVKNEALEQMAHISIWKKDFQKARAYLDEALSNKDSSTIHVAYTVAVMFHYEQNHSDSVLLYAHKLLKVGNIYNRYTAYKALASIYLKKGQPELALECQNKWEECDDSIRKRKNTETLARMHSLYNYHRYQASAVQMEQENSRLVIWLLSFALLLVLLATLVFFLLGYIRKRQAAVRQMKEKLAKMTKGLQEVKRELELLHLMKSQLADSNSGLNDEILHLNEMIDHKEKEKNVLLGKVSFLQSKLEPSNLLAEKIEAPIVATFRRYATQVKEKPSEEEWRELCDLVDKTVPNFHAILSNNGELPSYHYRLCCLVRLGFDNTDIKVLISENLSNITMTYKNLHRKILQAPGSAKDFKNFIRRIGQEQLS